MLDRIPFAALALSCVVGAGRAVRAQDAPLPLTRSDAIASALSRGARLGVARADTSVAYAQLITARAFQNPTVATSYSRAVPNYHVNVDFPIDFPWIRRNRMLGAMSGRLAAQYRFQFERAAIALEVDTLYTRALAARERSALTRRTARDADSLRRMAVSRRDAGDASDLDVELATVSAGQQANVAAADSLEFISVLLDLQTVIGIIAHDVAVLPVDSLTMPPIDAALLAANTASLMMVADTAAGAPIVPGRTPLQVAAAEAAFSSAAQAVALERRSVWGSPSITAGFEKGDPSGGEPGILPTIGIALPIPLLNRNNGPIALATAERERARAELTLARIESQAEIARARRTLTIALSKVERDRALVTSANRVATMALTAYREGASTLPNVLEAERSAREVLTQYVDDLAAVWNASAALRVLTLTPDTVSSR